MIYDLSVHHPLYPLISFVDCVFCSETRVFNVAFNDNVTLVCPGAEGSPARTRMTWTKQHCGEERNYVFPKKKAAGKRYYSSTPEELMIKAVILSDSGMYFCNRTEVGYLNVTNGEWARQWAT